MSCEDCKICGELKFDWKDHNCPLIFYFKHEDWGEEFQEIRAWSFSDASARFAEMYNEEGDYTLMNNTVEVLISDGQEEKKFKVSANTEICYSSEEVE